MRYKKDLSEAERAIIEVKRFDNLLIKPSRYKKTCCWIFPFTNPVTGYGVHTLFYAGKSHSISAHRHAWTLVNGPIPKGMQIGHHCDNRACSRIEHLFLCTAQQNADDMKSKGRSSRFADRKPKVPLSTTEKATILSDYEKGKTIYSISLKLQRDFKTVQSWLNTRQKKAVKQKDKLIACLRTIPLPNTETSIQLSKAA
jgi:hypothetical protein